jgi:hypothetical protein
MTQLDQFTFVTEAPVHPDLVVDASIVGKQSLLTAYAEALEFPDYFGENWDAFIDCLSDLTWTTAEEIVIFHRQLPGLEANDLSIYLSCLHDVLERRAARGAPRLRIVFDEALRSMVR